MRLARLVLIAHYDPFSISFIVSVTRPTHLSRDGSATLSALSMGQEVTMAFVPAAGRRVTIYIRRGIAIALLSVGAVVAVAWTGFLAYFIITLMRLV